MSRCQDLTGEATTQKGKKKVASSPPDYVMRTLTIWQMALCFSAPSVYEEQSVVFILNVIFIYAT